VPLVKYAQVVGERREREIRGLSFIRVHAGFEETGALECPLEPAARVAAIHSGEHVFGQPTFLHPTQYARVHPVRHEKRRKTYVAE
jgi:hypothetical protein